MFKSKAISHMFLQFSKGCIFFANYWGAAACPAPPLPTALQVRQMCDQSGSHYMLIMILVRYILEVWELLTGHQKVSGLIPVWGSEIVFLMIELYERSSMILRYLQAPTRLKHISGKKFHLMYNFINKIECLSTTSKHKKGQKLRKA